MRCYNCGTKRHVAMNFPALYAGLGNSGEHNQPHEVTRRGAVEGQCVEDILVDLKH